jgi:hypothetical protein
VSGFSRTRDVKIRRVTCYPGWLERLHDRDAKHRAAGFEQQREAILAGQLHRGSTG